MKNNVAVLFGGRSGEHEISIRSAKSILAAVDRETYSVREIFITKDGVWEPGPILPQPGANGDIDVVFPALHGTFGEDGTMQGLLELADLPLHGMLVGHADDLQEAGDRLPEFRRLGIAGKPAARDERLRFRREQVFERLADLLFRVLL